MEFLDPDAEQVAERAGVAARADPLILIDDAAEEGDDRGAALAHVVGEPCGVVVRDEVERWHQHQVVGGEVAVRRQEIGGDAGIPQCTIEGVHLIQVAEVRGGVGITVAGPPGFPAEDDGGAGGDRAAGHLAEPAQGVPEFGDFTPDLRVGAGVGEHGGVELLASLQRGAPLEEAQPVRAAGQVCEGIAQQLTGCLGDVAGLPVDGAGGMFHQEPGAVPGEAAGEVRGERDLLYRVGEAVIRVVVIGDDVHFRRPLPVVLGADVGGDHEVGGDRKAAVCTQHSGFRAVVPEEFV